MPIIINFYIWIFGIGEHNATACKNHNTPLVTVVRDRKDFLDLLVQFAASAGKHKEAPRVNVSNKSH